MNRHAHQDVVSQCTFLREQLQTLPASAVLTRGSAEARLRSLEAELAEAGPAGAEPARARLTFRGRPVVNGHGVFADFGTKATNAFADAVTKIGASLFGPLPSKGPVPNREGSQLLITSTAVGSFGFELEEYKPDVPIFPEESTAALALEEMRSLLQSTLGTDDELTESVVAFDPRALDAVRDFLDIVATNEAACTFEYGNRPVRFADPGQVRRSLGRLGKENVHEDVITHEGAFQGFLPDSRAFEFKRADTTEIIRGRVAATVADADAINQHLHERAQIQLRATHVGNGKPRYVLIAAPEWLDKR
jgi:hypothetical protein